MLWILSTKIVIRQPEEVLRGSGGERDDSHQLSSIGEIWIKKAEAALPWKYRVKYISQGFWVCGSWPLCFPIVSSCGIPELTLGPETTFSSICIHRPWKASSWSIHQVFWTIPKNLTRKYSCFALQDVSLSCWRMTIACIVTIRCWKVCLFLYEHWS